MSRHEVCLSLKSVVRMCVCAQVRSGVCVWGGEIIISLKDHRESECRAGAEAARRVRLYLGLLTVESPPSSRYLLL